MTCEELIEQLPLLVYEELSETDAVAAQAHLAECEDCRVRERELCGVRSALDRLPEPEATSQPLLRFAEAVAAGRREKRRWRGLAIGSSLVAVVLMIVVITQCTFDLRDGAFTIAWGETKTEPEPQTLRPGIPSPDVELVSELKRTRQLLAALTNRHESTQNDLEANIHSIAAAVTAWKAETDRQWEQTRKDVSALYTAQFGTD